MGVSPVLDVISSIHQMSSRGSVLGDRRIPTKMEIKPSALLEDYVLKDYIGISVYKILVNKLFLRNNICDRIKDMCGLVRET
jgi:hypothetical protein